MCGLFVQPEDRWTRRDWTIVLVSALVFGTIYMLWDDLYQQILVGWHLNLATTSLINGMWFMGGLVPMALTRKPGTCLVGETLAALWEVTLVYLIRAGHYPIEYAGETYTSFLFGSLAHPEAIREYTVFNVVFFVGILEGLGPEMMFALKRYRDFRLPTWLLAGAAGAVLEWMTGIWVTHYYVIEPPAIFWSILVTSILGIGVIAGSISWAISRRAHGGRETEPAAAG